MNEGLPSTQVLYWFANHAVSGKRSAGGQKRKWNDVPMGDLKRCDLLEDWKETVQDRGA